VIPNRWCCLPSAPYFKHATASSLVVRVGLNSCTSINLSWFLNTTASQSLSETLQLPSICVSCVLLSVVIQHWLFINLHVPLIVNRFLRRALYPPLHKVTLHNVFKCYVLKLKELNFSTTNYWRQSGMYSPICFIFWIHLIKKITVASKGLSEKTILYEFQ
jgi:hypothetical protein